MDTQDSVNHDFQRPWFHVLNIYSSFFNNFFMFFKFMIIHPKKSMNQIKWVLTGFR